MKRLRRGKNRCLSEGITTTFVLSDGLER